MTFDYPLLLITYLGDPVRVFLILFPLVYWCMSERLGTSLLLIILCTDVTNALLKWPLAGDRPYWYSTYVREFTSVTCESGFGLPSGHAMVSAAVAYTLLKHLERHPALKRDTKRRITFFCIIAVCLIAWSRIHIGAHFPGQVLLGALCGWAIAAVSCKYNLLAKLENGVARRLVKQMSFKHMYRSLSIGALLSSCLIVVAAIELVLLRALNIDPLLSVQHAQQGCGNFKVAAQYYMIPTHVQEVMFGSTELSSSAEQFIHSSHPLLAIIRDAAILTAILAFLFVKAQNEVTLNDGGRRLAVNTSSNVELGISAESGKIKTLRASSGSEAATSIKLGSALNKFDDTHPSPMQHSLLLEKSAPLSFTARHLVVAFSLLFAIRWLLHASRVIAASLTDSEMYDNVLVYLLNYVEFTALTLAVLHWIPAITAKSVKR